MRSSGLVAVGTAQVLEGLFPEVRCGVGHSLARIVTFLGVISPLLIKAARVIIRNTEKGELKSASLPRELGPLSF